MHRLQNVRILVFGVLLVCGSAYAQTPGSGGPADEYFRGYILKGEAERVEQGGDLQTALTKYKQAQEIFDSIAKNYPVWETQMLTYRRQKLGDAIKLVEGKIANPAPAPAQGASPAETTGGGLTTAQTPGPVSVPAAQPNSGASPMPNPGWGPDGLPRLGDFLNNYEKAYRDRIEKLDQQNKQFAGDLEKWQKWYEWASGELKASKETTNALAQRGAALEQAVAQMQKEAASGKANSGELKALKQLQEETAAQLKQATQKLAASEKIAKDAADKLAEATASAAKLQTERDTAVKDRDAKQKELDDTKKMAETANAERDKLAAETLGMKSELDAMKKTMGNGSNKDMLAKNQQLRKELDAAQATIETLKGDLSKKDAEITQLKGQLTAVQGELMTLRKQNADYQAQVAELTTQLKDVQAKMDSKTPETPEMMAENQLLRGIILRQLRAQARQQEAKSNVIAELQKTENASKELLQQVQELGSARVTLTPDEEKLFTEPQLKEALSGAGFQATLMASSSEKPGEAPKADTKTAKADTPAAMMEKANQLLQDEKLEEAAAVYQDILRAEPKNASALIGLGAAKMRAGKYADAEVALKKCLTFEPENETAHFTLGITSFKQGSHREAMTSFEKSLTKNPQNARAHHYLGIIATKMNLMERAEREFKAALAIDPTFGDAHFNLAVLYISWDPPKWDQARTHYADALKKGVKPDANLEKILNTPPAVSAR